MAYAQYEGTGGIHADNGGGAASITPSFPSGIQENDILILCQLDTDTGGINSGYYTAPSGWTEIFQTTGRTLFSGVIFWKRADGTESGTLLCLNGNSETNKLHSGIIYRFSGCVTTGTPFESFDAHDIDSTTNNITLPSLPTSGTDRLIASFNLVRDNTYSGATLNGFTEDSRLTNTVGGDSGFAVGTHELVGTGAKDPCIGWQFTQLEWSTIFILAFIPAATGGGGNEVKINIADTFKTMAAAKINIGDSWKDVVAIKINVGGIWKDVL